MTRSEMRYTVKEEKNGKIERFYVWDKEERRVKKGKLKKEDAIGLEGTLNGMPHKEKK